MSWPRSVLAAQVAGTNFVEYIVDFIGKPIGYDHIVAGPSATKLIIARRDGKKSPF